MMIFLKNQSSWKDKTISVIVIIIISSSSSSSSSSNSSSGGGSSSSSSSSSQTSNSINRASNINASLYNINPKS
jgi:preprotein translocase subunit SecG